MNETPSTSRKVGYTHLAFYRGWLQGLPLRQMADAYLETGLDLRVAQSTLRWIQDELRRAALRHGQHGRARLLRLRIRESRSAGDGQPASVPSIDDFREDFDPSGFYNYDELMVHYLERYPSAGDAKAKKRAVLIERQLAALNWIEGLLVTTPVPADPIRAWLDPNVAKHLESQNLMTLANLIEWISARGYHWHRHIPHFGVTRAARIVTWLDHYAATLGKLPEYATVKPTAATVAMKRRPLVEISPLPVPVLQAPGTADVPAPIVPLEAMLVPRGARVEPAPPDARALMDGSRIAATDDRAAIESWLNAQGGSDATFRAYRKEAERVVLWAARERGTTLGGLGVEDCTAYRDWLCMLGRMDDAAWPYRLPQSAWFAPRWVKRYSPAWRPFEGPLSPASVRYSLTVCRTLFAWLAKVRYLDFDPWPVVAPPRAVKDEAPDLELSRVFSREDWTHLLESVATINDASQRLRATLLLHLALVTGMRLAEIADCRYDRVYTRPTRDGKGVRWNLKVHGKGDKWRSVPLTDDVLQLMREDLRARKLPDDPRSLPDGVPIIVRLDGEAALGASGLAKLIKAVFAIAERRLVDAGRHDDAVTFSRASMHWIRHTTGAFLGNSGTPASQIQQLLGHVSLATTTIYTSTGNDELYKSVSAALAG